MMDRNEFLSSFENVCELFENIQSVSSRIAKEALLENYPDKEFLKDILLYTYNPYYVYGIDSKTVQNHNSNMFHVSEMEDIYELLDYLKVNNGGSQESKNLYYAFINQIGSKFLESWATKIVLKDLKIGINLETINKIFPKLIPQFKVGLCKTYENASSLRYENYIVQPKLDGVRIIGICKNGSAELYTRNGMKVEGYDDVVKDLSNECWQGYVVDGEIMTDNFDGTMEGLFALKKDKKAVYHIFDIMTVREFEEQKCQKDFESRFNILRDKLTIYSQVTGVNYCLRVVTGKLHSKKDIVSDISILDEDARSLGYEGLVLKGLEAPYEFCTPSRRSWGWVKYKAWKSEDFEIIGFEEGTGKYEGMLGAIVVNVEGVSVKVGSGFSDEQRDWIWNDSNDTLGMMAEVKYQEKTKDGSLRFPSFIKFRNDI